MMFQKLLKKILMQLFPEIPQQIPFWRHSYFRKDFQLCRPTGPLMKEETLLSYFLQSRTSQVYGVDIHPAATIGKGIMLDHATGIVIGETSVIEDDVSIFQGVTLGGTGKEVGDRHPKVRKGVLISSGAKILGNVEIGEGAKIAAGSVVLEDVPEHMTVAGVPAKVVGKTSIKTPGTEIDHTIEEN